MKSHRRFKSFLVIAVTAILLISLIAGCAPKQEPAPMPAPAPAPAPKPAPKPPPAPAPKPTPAPAPKAEKIQWDLSVWGGPRGFTRPLENWAADMNTLSNGRWEIKIHYGGVLAEAKDNVDGVKAGLFQAGVSTGMYHPGKTPLHTVFELPFLTPEDNMDIARLQMMMEEHPAMIKEFDKWNAVVMLSPMADQYNLIMSNKRVATIDDLDGLRIRLAPTMAGVLEKFGAVGSMLALGETYTALERGTVDAVGAAASWAGGWNFQEVTKYATTGMAMGTASMFVFASKDAWNALPDDLKELHKWWQAKSGEEWAIQRELDSAKYLPAFAERMEFIKFPPEDRAKLVAEAQPIWKDWVKRMEDQGLPGQEVLDYLIAKNKEIQDAKEKK